MGGYCEHVGVEQNLIRIAGGPVRGHETFELGSGRFYACHYVCGR